MMHGFLSNLTAAMLAMHTVLGCCWHHAHSCTKPCGLARCVETPDSGGENHATHTVAAADSSGDPHHGQHECLGATCSFLGPTKENPAELPPQIHASAVIPLLCGDFSIPASAEWQEFFACDALSSPLRLHLMHCVLLI